MVSTLVHGTNITRKMFKPGNKYGALTKRGVTNFQWCGLDILLLQKFIRVKNIQLKKLVILGHSSLNVSLTYLRGLEVAELKEEDMPMV